MKNQLIDSLNSLVAAPDGAQRWAAAERIADQMGVESFHIGEADVSTWNVHWISSTMQPSWIEEYVANDYLRNDPVIDDIAYRPGRILMPCGEATKHHYKSEAAWEISHGLRGQGYKTLHCVRFGEVGSLGKYVTQAFSDQNGAELQRDIETRDLFAALLASTIGPTTAPEDLVQATPSRYQLTPRQRDVLSLLAEGYQTARIAEKLGLTEATVTLHFVNVRKKLDANTREQALVIALQHGLISL